MQHGRASAGWLLLLPALALLAGCVERRMVIMTEPYPDASGAIVYNEQHLPLGASPADRPFTYYGTYEFTIVKDGFETLVVKEEVKAPWYEIFPLDFVSENVIPFTIRDVRRFKYCLQPLGVRSPEQVLQEASQLRAYGQAGGTPLPQPIKSQLPAAPGPTKANAMPPAQ